MGSRVRGLPLEPAQWHRGQLCQELLAQDEVIGVGDGGGGDGGLGVRDGRGQGWGVRLPDGPGLLRQEVRLHVRWGQKWHVRPEGVAGGRLGGSEEGGQACCADEEQSGHLLQEEEREGRVIEGGKEKVSVSQSSSVSKVSVKMGGVSISGRDTKELRGERKLAAGFNQLEADVRQSFFQQLLDRLQDLADVRVEEEESEENKEELAEWSKEGEEETHHHLNSLEEAPVGYQLIYRDDEVDDYTDYYGIPYVYYTDEDYADILEEEQLRLEESWQAPESLAASPMELLPRLPEEGRSSFARGRALTFDVADNQGEKN